ncbi:MAG: SDR family NAD(P)-dependent oxidoreductase [Gammaproteobacteria bacterium]|nr:SDR family NAD(P)-dependent oxidoreductase [Gammaproteobacteria bacterium]MDH4255559.1 SDR family NAD(P)-dependent oxidoreductase [Gammaproteobacteria bacterium]MDH5310555.1 SDR family NAD(P)-dependent oxidoreductase [Gammaproteobacteria bacterium]
MKKGLPQLGGKVMVITGAASGIGRELALQLCRKGGHLALVDLDADGLQQLQTELAGIDASRRVTLHVADVADKARMGAVCDEVIEAHRTVHLLVNNAGIAYEAAFPQTGLEALERVLAVNLWGTIYGCHYFLPQLAKAGRAHIVNVSSLFGIVGMAGQTAYCTSKYAVRGFSESLFEELRDTTVGLTVVHPGSVATNIMKTAEGDDPQLLKRIADWFEANAIPPASAARQIIKAVEKGNPRLLISPEVKFADIVKRLAPVRGNKAIVDLTVRALGLEDMREKRRRQWQETMIDGEPRS